MNISDARKKRIYLDYGAGAPLDPLVLDAMVPYLSNQFGNPSAIYQEGMNARRALDESRDNVANVLGCHSDELIFVGSGTESDNLAIVGVVDAYHSRSSTTGAVPHIITSVIEHPAVLDIVESLELEGRITATYVGVNNEGIVNPDDIRDALTENTILVSIMYANSEIGTIQPIRDIAKIVQAYRGRNTVVYPYIHTDAAQAMNYLDTDVELLGVDLLSCNGSKIYGPKGVGLLYAKRGVLLEAQIKGGGQELGRRAGTENVAGIVGFAKALEITAGLKLSEGERLKDIQTYFLKRLLKDISNCAINGSESKRLPNNINISIQGVENDMVVIAMDVHGIACSSKSACKSSDSESSYVVRALGGEHDSDGTVRFTMGRDTQKEDVDVVVDSLVMVVHRARNL